MESSDRDTQQLFLSYRREDSAGHAGRIADHLLDRFGTGSVFMDIESIEAGADFPEAIASAIASADAVLVVIGPKWLDGTGPDGNRRLDEESDFVRQEVEAALGSNVRVIPVLVDGASMPTEERLPPAIAALARRNAIELQNRRWREDVDALVDVLEGRGKARAGNLPAQPTPFLGRAGELAEIVELVRRDDVRLLTLTGPGGIGKTRLAIQAATGLMPNYPGGAWFVGLAPLTDPDLALAELASVLGVREAIEGSLVRAIAERVSRAHTLIVLDNLEQLLPVAAIPIAELSAAALSLDLIVSSREPLHLAAEREYPVPTLSQVEAIDLFVARAVRPVFDQDADSQRDAIDQICTRLDRLPLAIELAAARVKVLAPAALLERLEQRLPLLTGGPRDVPQRQRTLRATIGWSYDLLSEDEQLLFDRLGVFAGGWTFEAAEAVCGADLDVLQSLIERNLVRQEEGAGGGSRNLMLETIHEFALDQLQGRPDAEAVRRRHAEYFLEVAKSADRHLKGPDQLTWLDRLDAEHDNHRAALGWALDGADPDLGLRLVVELYWVWYLRRPLFEIRAWLALALERTPSIATEARARALHQIGFLIGTVGEREMAIATLEEAIRCARTVGARATEAFASSNLSNFLPPARGDEIVPLGKEAVSLARESGDRWVLAASLNNLGEAYQEAGDGDAAANAYEESYRLLREMGDRSRMALVLGNLAEVAIRRGDLPRARTLASEALELAEALGDGTHASWAQTALGWVALDEGDQDAAAEYFEAALRRVSDIGSRQYSITVLFGLAGSAAASGDVARAARLETLAARFEEILGHQPSAADGGIHRRYIDELRASTDASVWEAGAREGAAMSLDEGIEYALSASK